MDSIIWRGGSKQIVEIGENVYWLLIGLLSLRLLYGVEVYVVGRWELRKCR